jgi:hypothetical protein
MTAEGTGRDTSARAPADLSAAPAPDAAPRAEFAAANGAALALGALPFTGPATATCAAVLPPPDAPELPAHPAAAPASPESTTVAATATVARRIPVIAHPFAVGVTQTGETS